jgi:hypothetical protein
MSEITVYVQCRGREKVYCLSKKGVGGGYWNVNTQKFEQTAEFCWTYDLDSLMMDYADANPEFNSYWLCDLNHVRTHHKWLPTAKKL